MAEPNATAAAQAVLEDLGMSTEAEETPSVAEEAAVEPEGQHEAAEPVTIPDEIQELLNEPDFEEEVEAEVHAEEPGEFEPEGYEDEALTAERKLRLKAEKRAAWLEEQRAKENKGKWEAEALKYFPHSKPFLAKIDASSRRAYLRAASDYHETVAAHVAELSPGTSEADREQMKAELKAELEAAWGKPLTGPGQVPGEASEKQEAWEEAAARRDQLGMIKARGYHKLLG